jgi:hypothetical protein
MSLYGLFENGARLARMGLPPGEGRRALAALLTRHAGLM